MAEHHTARPLVVDVVMRRTFDVDEAGQLGGTNPSSGCRERAAGSVPGSKQPTGLHDMEEGNHGYD